MSYFLSCKIGWKIWKKYETKIMEPDVNYVTEYHANYDITQEKKRVNSHTRLMTNGCHKNATNLSKIWYKQPVEKCLITNLLNFFQNGVVNPQDLQSLSYNFYWICMKRLLHCSRAHIFNGRCTTGRGESALKARADARLLLSNGILGS
jgi:hypothetical protein